jgi:hypothetical protein
MLHAQCHTALRTQPYACDLNTAETVWANTKHCVRCYNTIGDMSLWGLSNRQQLVWLLKMRLFRIKWTLGEDGVTENANGSSAEIQGALKVMISAASWATMTYLKRTPVQT